MMSRNFTHRILVTSKLSKMYMTKQFAVLTQSRDPSRIMKHTNWQLNNKSLQNEQPTATTIARHKMTQFNLKHIAWKMKYLTFNIDPRPKHQHQQSSSSFFVSYCTKLWIKKHEDTFSTWIWLRSFSPLRAHLQNSDCFFYIFSNPMSERKNI